MKEKTIYFGGTILTCDSDHPKAEAVLVDDGVIVGVGKQEELFKLCPEAKKVDLKGKTLLPGFIDGHSHMNGVGASFRKCDLTDVKDFDEILSRILAFRKERGLTHGELIIARGYDQNSLKEKKHPDRFVLDRLGISNPVLCYHVSGHMLGCNTAALEQAGVDDSFIDPVGGFSARDENGKLTGYFEEKAKVAISPLISNFSVSDFEEDILNAQGYYSSFGYTTVQDGSALTVEKLSVYEELARQEKLLLDTVVYVSLNTAKKIIEENRSRTIGRLTVGGIKFFLDGSPQAKTAWLSAPYEGEESYCGYPTMTDDAVREILAFAVEHNFQPIAHCNGDAASEQFLSLWEEIINEKGCGQDLRPIMIHAQTVRKDQLERMKKCGMMASFFIGHCHFWGDTHLMNLGSRGQVISPAGTALKLGIPFSFHQDSPVTPPDMLHSITCAVCRKTKNGVYLSKEERVSVADALSAATVGGAYGYFMEGEKGLIRKGYKADFVILEEDPTEVSAEKIKDVSVLATVKSGETVYQK